MSDAFAQWFEAVWSDREDRVYRSLFGDLGEGVFTAGGSVYERFQKKPHPGWLNHGVFACPPNDDRPSWLYVTSGLSNPWNLERTPGGSTLCTLNSRTPCWISATRSRGE